MHGLRLVLAEMNLGEALGVSPEGFLVLTRPDSAAFDPRRRESRVPGAARRARTSRVWRESSRQLGGSTDPNVVIPAHRAEADTNHCEACLSFCDRAPVPRASLQSGDAGVLGDEVRLISR